MFFLKKKKESEEDINREIKRCENSDNIQQGGNFELEKTRRCGIRKQIRRRSEKNLVTLENEGREIMSHESTEGCLIDYHYDAVATR